MTGIEKTLLVTALLGAGQVPLALLLAPHRSWAITVYLPWGLATAGVALLLPLFLARELGPLWRVLLALLLVPAAVAAWGFGFWVSDMDLLTRMF